MNEIDRREFLRKAARMAGGGAWGLAAMHSFGMDAVKEAMGWGPLPAVVSMGGAAVNSSWATWDELAETGWSDTTNVNICFQENTAAGGNETSLGVVSGADLVWTQAGNVAGATGTPPSRVFDGGDDLETVTENFIEGVYSGASAWSTIMCFNPFTATANGTIFLNWNGKNDIGQQDLIQMWIANAGTPYLWATVTKNAAGILNSQITDTYPTGVKIYMVICSDGSETMGGWITSKPTKLSDFPASQRVLAGAGCSFLAANWTGAGYASTSFMAATAGTVRYMINAKTCLIDLGA